MVLLKGVLLDVDGTLIDSNLFHARAWHEALKEANIQVPLEKLAKLIGMGADHLMPAACGIEKESDLGKKINESCAKLFKTQFLPHVKPFPHASDLVERLHRNGLKVCIATSAQQEMAEHFIQLLKIERFVDQIVCSTDVKHSKPAPDIIEAGKTKLKLEAEEVVMLGDTPYDIQSAQAAGVKTICVRSGGWDNHELKGAQEIYENTADIFENYEKSYFHLKNIKL